LNTNKSLEQLRLQKDQQFKDILASLQFQSLMMLVLPVILLVLGIVILFVGRSVINQGIHAPIQRIIKQIPTRQHLAVSDDEMGKIIEHINKLHIQLTNTERVISALAENSFTVELAPEKLNQTLVSGLNGIRDRLKSLSTELVNREVEIKEIRKSAYQKEVELKSQLENLQLKYNGLLQIVAFAESDTQGNIIQANALFCQLCEYTTAEIVGQSFRLLNSGFHEKSYFENLWTVLQAGNVWNGIFCNKTKSGKLYWQLSTIMPVNDLQGKKSYYVAAQDISVFKTNEEEMRIRLANAVKELEQKNQDSILLKQKYEAEMQLLQETLQAQKQLELRLVKQQAALQELARNPDLKEGNVREAVRFITENTAYTLDQPRVALFLITDNSTKIRCLDLFEKLKTRHSESFELSEGISSFLIAIQTEQVINISDARNDTRTRSLTSSYLLDNQIYSILAAPVRLSGNVVGVFCIEHTDTIHKWTLDEQNFVISVADLISLLLEQGNRRAIEDQLRLTIDESMAMEEELRQNAEEIEATNEEMRRAQIELRGQITALNNAAIVSESDLSGMIIYVNNEFTKLYKYSKAELIGKKHAIIRSDYHQSAFFEKMWATIVSGKIWKGQIQNKAADGTAVWVSLSITPVMGLEGNPIKYIGVGFDITSQKEQEYQIQQTLEIAIQQQELLNTSAQVLAQNNEEMRKTQIELVGQISALNNASLVYETDMQGNITYINDEMLRITGLRRDELINQQYHKIFRADKQHELLLQEHWKAVLAGRIWKGELELTAKQQTHIWVMASSTPVLNEAGEPLKTINVLFNVNEQKLMEIRLRKQQKALLELSSHVAIKGGKKREGYKAISEIGLRTLAVDRVTIWEYSEDGEKLRCVNIAQRNKEIKNDEELILDREHYFHYFKLLNAERVIPITDVKKDPRTIELALGYHRNSDTVSLLDVTIPLGNKMVGVISFEHYGSVRNWTLDEQNFATALGDTASLLLEHKERKAADHIRFANEKLEEARENLQHQIRLIEAEKIEIESQKKDIEEKYKLFSDSIKYAKRTQKNILPDEKKMKEYLQNYFVIWKPKDVIGGDFYWFDALGSKRIIIVADGTGHGVPGAFLTLIGYMTLNSIITQQGITRPADILYHLHRGVRAALKQDVEIEDDHHQNRDGMDVAVCTYDCETLKVEFAGATLPLYHYDSAENEVYEIKADRLHIGGEQLEEERFFTNQEIQLKKGDAIYMFTDGFVDQFGGPADQPKRYSKKRFRDVILRTLKESMSTQRALINLDWRDWMGDTQEQIDDVTVFGLKI
jgi:PAS domain S-box-containing protein